MASRQYRVLCTRKLDEAWTDVAFQHHIVLESHDFLDIRPLSPELIRPAFEQNTHTLVFTSHHAVNAVAALGTDHPESLNNRSCFCIEGKTCTTAVEAGFDVLGSAKDACTLAAQIIVAGCEHVLHCSSKSRRPELEEMLTAAGIGTGFLEVYEKTAAPLSVPKADGIIFFSPSQIDAFLQSNMLDKSTPAFCIGATTAGHLAASGHLRIHIAWQPGTESILQTVFEHFKQG